jgi:hypothetical protein
MIKTCSPPTLLSIPLPVDFVVIQKESQSLNTTFNSGKDAKVWSHASRQAKNTTTCMGDFAEQEQHGAIKCNPGACYLARDKLQMQLRVHEVQQCEITVTSSF